MNCSKPRRTGGSIRQIHKRRCERRERREAVSFRLRYNYGPSAELFDKREAAIAALPGQEEECGQHSRLSIRLPVWPGCTDRIGRRRDTDVASRQRPRSEDSRHAPRGPRSFPVFNGKIHILGPGPVRLLVVTVADDLAWRTPASRASSTLPPNARCPSPWPHRG